MYLTSNLFDEVIDRPYNDGYRNLRILSGYASSAFLYHVVSNYPDINLELIVGMASKDGIRRSNHAHFIDIVTNNPNVSVKYHTSAPSIHTKIYHWYNEGLLNDSVTYVGSANFSWNGFRDQVELLARADYTNIEQVFSFTDAISCIDPAVTEYINLSNQIIPVTNQIGTVEPISDLLASRTPVRLSLLLNNDTAIHEKAGLNWGQREGREPNQAYIPVSIKVHRRNPDFFPPYEHPFTLITDDESSFLCVMSQANRKAIQTSLSNSILGRYFRQRLNVPLGARVDVQDVLNYGKTYVEIFKIDTETYFMDFSNHSS